MNTNKPHHAVGVDDRRKSKQEQSFRIPPRANLLAAASHIRALFDAKKFTWSFLGGLEILCLGYRREQPDLHIVYDSKDFERIRKKLEGDRRVQLPNNINSLLRSKILVQTGPQYKDENCTDTATIEVDLVPSGSHGTPQSGSLESNIVLLSLKSSDGKLKTFKGLNMLYMLKTTIQLCKFRDLAWDPRKDLLFLCLNYRDDVQSLRSQLDQKDVQELFLGTPFFSRLSLEEQRNCYHAILDREPPPVMMITPPAPQHSATATDEQQTQSNEKPQQKEVRSRYRKVSGPNGRNDSSQGVNQALRTKSADAVLLSQKHGGVSVPSTIRVVQDDSVKDPRVASAYALSVAQARRSMPNLATEAPHLALLNTSPHTRLAISDHNRRHSNIPAVGGSGKPDYFSPRDKSQLQYGTNFRPAYMDPKGEGHTTDPNGSPRQVHNLNPGPQLRTPEVLHSPTEGLQSQKGSLHETNQQGKKSPTKRNFHEVVDSDSLRTALNATKQMQNLSAQHRKHSSVPTLTPPQSVYELDATPKVQTQDPSQPPALIAELPATSTPSPTRGSLASTQLPHHPPSAAPSSPPSDNSPSVYSDSPSLPPWHEAAPAPLAPRARPRPVTVALDNLPLSLIAGLATSSHQRTSSADAAATPPQRPALRTNVSRYSRYYAQAAAKTPTQASAPSPKSSSANTSPERGDDTVYKAYRPSVVALTSPPLQMQMQTQTQLREREQGAGASAHKRDISHDSTTSQGSADLAIEYQAEMPEFERGYGK